MDFFKKNFVTILVVGATIILAGVAVFTALRLYNLRQEPITPVAPEETSASDAPIGIRPSSGSWNNPETFIVTNTSEKDVEIVWNIDCSNSNLCEDSNGTEVILVGGSVEYGLGSICSEWQLQVNWSQTSTAAGDVWDWAGTSELAAECDVKLDELTTVEEEVELAEPTTINTDIETIACSGFNFTLKEEVSTPSPTATAVVTPTPTIAATATPTLAPTIAPTATPTPIALPDAGVSAPTILGITAGTLLLFLSLVLAI